MINLFNIAELGEAFIAGAVVIGVLQRLALHATYEINKVKTWRLRRTSWAEAAVPTELRRRHHRMGWLAELGIKPVARGKAKRSDIELQDAGSEAKPPRAEEEAAPVEVAAMDLALQAEVGTAPVDAQSGPELATVGTQAGVEPASMQTEVDATLTAAGAETSRLDPTERIEAELEAVAEMDWFTELRRLVDTELEGSTWDKRYDPAARFVGRVAMPVDQADALAQEEPATEVVQLEAPDRLDWELGSDAYRPGFEVADQMAAKRAVIRRDLEVMRAHAAELLSTVEWPHVGGAADVADETVGSAEVAGAAAAAEAAGAAGAARPADGVKAADGAIAAEAATPDTQDSPEILGSSISPSDLSSESKSSPPANPGVAAPPRRNADSRGTEPGRTGKKRPRKVPAN